MTPRQILKTAPVAIATAFAALTAGSAMAETPFDACTDHNWSAFAAAVDSGLAADLESFLEVTGPNCPLRDTATLLLCQLDPAACLPLIEPAADRPEIVELIPEGPGRIITTVPGAHLGVERDNGRDGNDGGGNDGGGNDGGNGGPSSDSASGGNDKPGNDNPGNDNPGNDNRGNSITTAAF